MAQVATGLDHAHRDGVLHRDIKPANLLIDTAGGGERAVVSDVGIARVVDATLSAVPAGLTVAYAAPERFDVDTVLDHRTDPGLQRSTNC
ncbi:protein kinase domain-containing protein [Nocardia sp. CA-151230]|uniref:protein kinase domain-containing protein n=1 Tax=Nocardia sp. CA-151230 TaxID=3239982 RepID=UPI003D93C609